MYFEQKKKRSLYSSLSQRLQQIQGIVIFLLYTFAQLFQSAFVLCTLLSNYTWTISSLVSQKAISTDERDNKQIQWVSETWQQAGSYHKRRRASHPKGGMYKITQQPLAFGLRHLFLAQIPIHTNKICVCALTYKYIYVCMYVYMSEWPT